MATIIDRGDGSFIAGDPQTELEPDQHWCGWCEGDGLEWDAEHDDYRGGLVPCGGCDGTGATKCKDTTCTEHTQYARFTCPCGHRDLDADTAVLVERVVAHGFECRGARA